MTMVTRSFIQERIGRETPSCIEELAGRLYQASELFSSLYNDLVDPDGRLTSFLISPSTTLADFTEVTDTLDALASELEMLGDYVYNMTADGAEVRMICDGDATFSIVPEAEK